jgi:hypothetical protein
MNQPERENQSRQPLQATKLVEDRQHCEICNENYSNLVIYYSVVDEHENGREQADKYKVETSIRVNSPLVKIYDSIV